MSIAIQKLQNELREIEQRFEPLRASKQSGSIAWQDVSTAAGLVRQQLFDLTGDYYGRPKANKMPKPSDELLNDSYDSPNDVPAEVMTWVRKYASIITSDATDAVRWARIVGTEDDDRYPEGEITLYRAIGAGADLISEIRPGDWVTTNEAYAQDHLQRSLNGKGSILEMEVDGQEVLTSPTGNFEEAIYAPMEFSGEISRNVNNCERDRS